MIGHKSPRYEWIFEEDARAWGPETSWGEKNGYILLSKSGIEGFLADDFLTLFPSSYHPGAVPRVVAADIPEELGKWALGCVSSGRAIAE